MTSPHFGLFLNILFEMAVIDKRVRSTSFSPVINLFFFVFVTKCAIVLSLISFQSRSHMFAGRLAHLV
jgi:hypothetical protein